MGNLFVLYLFTYLISYWTGKLLAWLCNKLFKTALRPKWAGIILMSCVGTVLTIYYVSEVSGSPELAKLPAFEQGRVMGRIYGAAIWSAIFFLIPVGIISLIQSRKRAIQ